eukprot:XP_011443976.1 PREDICTED: uncharacterized protein LOC105339895 [Crassostrea gigas]
MALTEITEYTIRSSSCDKALGTHTMLTIDYSRHVFESGGGDDIEKKNYLNTTLVELVYDSTLEVCGRRKKYPPKLTINCRKILEAKTVQCVKTKIQLPDVKVCSHTTENGQKNSLTIEKLADSCKELTSQIKSVPDVVVKTERLKTSTDMFQNHKMTLPNGVLLNDSIVCLHEDTSLRSKLLLQLQ